MLNKNLIFKQFFVTLFLAHQIGCATKSFYKLPEAAVTLKPPAYKKTLAARLGLKLTSNVYFDPNTCQFLGVRRFSQDSVSQRS